MIKNRLFQMSAVVVIVLTAMLFSGCRQPVVESVSSPPAVTDGDIVIKVASSEGQNPSSGKIDPYYAGRTAAETLKNMMGDKSCHAVIITEFFEDKQAKSRALKGVCSVFDSSIVYGFASYGSFGQDGCSDNDTIRIVGIAGDGISVAASIQQDLGIGGLTMEDDASLIKERLQAAGEAIAGKISKTESDKMLMLIADAHSPKNAHLVEGAQKVLGNDFPITGGSANKNPGQTFIYYQGRMFADCAIAFMLGGDFMVSLAGRKARENSKVISSAGQCFKEALSNLDAEPVAAFAFNCGGRKGKLDNLEDELAAIQNQFGKTLPLFGAYCAGEIGPADTSEKIPGVLSTGTGWHLMTAVIGK